MGAWSHGVSGAWLAKSYKLPRLRAVHVLQDLPWELLLPSPLGLV